MKSLSDQQLTSKLKPNSIQVTQQEHPATKWTNMNCFLLSSPYFTVSALAPKVPVTPLVEKDGTTAKPSLADHERDATAKPSLADHERDATAKPSLADHERDATAKPSLADHERDATAKPSLADHERDATAKPSLADHERDSFYKLVQTAEGKRTSTE